MIGLNFDNVNINAQLQQLNEEQKRCAEEFQNKKQADERDQLALAKEQAIKKIEEIHKKQADKWNQISGQEPKRKQTPKKSTPKKSSPTR